MIALDSRSNHNNNHVLPPKQTTTTRPSPVPKPGLPEETPAMSRWAIMLVWTAAVIIAVAAIAESHMKVDFQFFPMIRDKTAGP